MQRDPKNILKEYFGYDSFRTGQEAIINSVMKRRDTLGILPTGGGKSICYQVPALCNKGLTLVISPLISLMKDQIDTMHNHKIAAEMINSTVPSHRQQMIRELAEQGELDLLYLTPERFRNEHFTRWLSSLDIALFTIDEAHCISEWGHDFRPEYRNLADIIKKLGNPPILALTATATEEVQQDIIKALKMRKPDLHIGGFNRPGLIYGVRHCTTRENKNRQLLEFVKKAANPGIIYTVTIRDAEYVYNYLRTNSDLKVGLYHGSLSTPIRKIIQEDFLAGIFQVLVATSAFGMGVNKSDIRFVVHYAIPGTLEAYYQETGRAGRDGETSFCLLLYQKEDRNLQKFFIKSRSPDLSTIELALQSMARKKGKVRYSKDELSSLFDNLDINKYQIDSLLTELSRLGCLSSDYAGHPISTIKLLKPKNLRKAPPLIREIFPYPDKNRYIEITLADLARRYDFPIHELKECLQEAAENDFIEFDLGQSGTIYTILKTTLTTSQKKEYTQRTGEKSIIDYKKLDAMVKYTSLSSCRRKYLLNYFGESSTKNCCGGCDICRNSYIDPAKKPLTEAQYKMVLFFLQHDTKIGRKRALKIFCGSADIEPRYRYWEEYGLLKPMHINDIEGELKELFENGLLEITGNKYRLVTVTKSGLEKVRK